MERYRTGKPAPGYLIGLSGALGLAWGIVNQPIPGLLRLIPAGAALWNGWMVLVWPLALLVLLGWLARARSPGAAAAAGGLALGGAVLGWYGCHLALLALGFGPPGTQWTAESFGGLAHLGIFFRQTVLGWLLRALLLGGALGGAAGLLGRRRWPLRQPDPAH